MRALLLGVVLLLAGFGLNWVQDVAAPWLNLAEARIGTPVTFESGGGRYRVVTSGPLRPEIDRTICEVDPEDGRPFTRFGGQDVNATTHFGVSRVLSFRAPAGGVRITSASATCRGRTTGATRWWRPAGPSTSSSR